MPVHTIKPTQARVLLTMLESEDPAGQVPQDGARKTLLDIAHSLRTTSGSVKPGYLRIVQGDDGRLDFTLKRIGHNAQNDDFANVAKALIRRAYPDHHQQAEQAIEAYLQNRSGGKFGSQSFVKLIAQLESRQYGNDAPAREGSREAEAQNLSAQVRTMRLKQDGFFSNAPRLDTSELVPQSKLENTSSQAETQVVNTQEQPAVPLEQKGSQPPESNSQQIENEPRSVSQAEPPQQESIEKIVDPSGQPSIENAKPPQVVDPPEGFKAIAKLGLEPAEAKALEAVGIRFGKRLGQGGMGVAYVVTQDDGKQLVYKTIQLRQRMNLPLTLNRGLTTSGGYLTYLKTPSKTAPDYHKQEMIVAPTHLMVIESRPQGPKLMSVAQSRELLKELTAKHPKGRQAEVTLMGELSSLAPGVDLYQPKRTAAYPEADQKDIFRQLLEMAVANRQRGIVHRDLKGENIKFDTNTRQLSVFDWDLAYKVSKKVTSAWNLPLTSAPLGSWPYMHPATMGNQPCGFEADAHAIAMIALENRFPTLMPSMQHAMVLKCADRTKQRGMKDFYDVVKADGGLPESFTSFSEKPIQAAQYLTTLRGMVEDLVKYAPQAIAQASAAGDVAKQQLYERRLIEAQAFLNEAGWAEGAQARPATLVRAALDLMADAHEPARFWLDKSASTKRLQERLAQVQES